MTKTVNKDDAGWPKSITISCDVCGKSHKDAEIIAKGGLTKMGWLITGGAYRCPEHREEIKA